MAASCGTRLALFSWRFVVPLVIFVFCYWKIISALRHQASHRDQPVAGPSTSTAAAASGRAKPPSKTQKNVIKTMIVIISCFAVCWLPVQFVIMAHLCGMVSVRSRSLYYALAAIAYLYLCANPFIYATGIYQFLRVWFVAGLRRLVRRDNQVANVDEQNLATAERRNDASASTSRV